MHEDDYDIIISELKANGAYYIEDAAEKDKLRKVMFIDGVMNRDVVGQPITKVAELAGIKIPDGTKLIAVKADGIEGKTFSAEKRCVL